jgi:poly(glycerol-phosphate) alpha-glucosyltransferase
LCASEAENFRKYGLRNPIAIIPNGVELETSGSDRDPEQFQREHPDLKGRRLLLFLSRVHPKKGLPDLLRAWAKVGAGDRHWSLLVVGPNELDHETELRQLAAELAITRHIHFMGPAYGAEKRKFLHAADGLVLPSHSEGFSMAVLEAAAAGLPVLFTKECNFPELAAAGAAIEVSAGPTGIPQGLEQFLNLTDAQRHLMGSRGRELVEQSYTWPAVAGEMARVYEWLATKSPKPDCVELG